MHTMGLHWIKKLFFAKIFMHNNRMKQKQKSKLTRTKSGDQCALGMLYIFLFPLVHIRDQYNRQALGQIATE